MHTTSKIFLVLLAAGAAGCPLDTFGVSTTEPASAGSGEESPESGRPMTGTGASDTDPEATGAPTTGESSSGAPTTGDGSVCGDGVLAVGEECDHGEANGADQACTPGCRLASCGDGFVAYFEACDDGNSAIDDACVACELATCGDGATWSGVEDCDDGAESATCDVDCSAAVCGDGQVNQSAGESCDAGIDNGAYAGDCNETCDGPGPFCGDGAVQAGDEVCDTAVAVGGGSCASGCAGLACSPGRGDCDGDAATGCEIDLLTSKQNCGGCGDYCVWQCKQGSCDKDWDGGGTD